MATYYYAEGGSAANKESATSGTYPGGCMSPATAVSESAGFSAGDQCLASDEGGDIRATITPGSSGSDGSPIVWGVKSGDSPVINGSDLIATWSTEDTPTDTVSQPSSETVFSCNADCIIETTFTFEASKSVTIKFRHQDNTNWVRGFVQTDGDLSLEKRDTGTVTEIASSASVFSDGVEYTVRITATGTSIVIDVNDVVKINETLDFLTAQTSGKIWTSLVTNDLELVSYPNPRAENVWSATLTTEPAKVYIDGNDGDKKSSVATLVDEYDWWWDSNKLYLYSLSDPDSNYTTPGIEATIRDGGFVADTKDYLTVNGLEIKYTERHGVDLTICDDVIVTGVQVHHCGYAGNNNGFLFNGCNNLLAQGLTANNNSYNGIQMGMTYDTAASAVSGMILEDSDSYSNGHNEIDVHVAEGGGVKNVSDVTVQRCLVTGNIQILNTSASYTLSDIKVLYNVVKGSINCQEETLLPDQVLLYGNTVTGSSGNGMNLHMTNSEIKNNIIAFNDTTPTGSVELKVNDHGGTANVANYNLVYHPSNSDIVEWDGVARTWAEWQADGHNLNGVNADPSFTNAGADDYTLASDSPCIDTGADLGASYDDALDPSSTWPSAVVTIDQDVCGPGWEIGAYARIAAIVADSTGASVADNLTMAFSAGAITIPDAASASLADNLTMAFSAGSITIPDSASASVVDNLTMTFTGGASGDDGIDGPRIMTVLLLR